MRHRVILAVTAFTLSATCMAVSAAPLMGDGDLAVIGAQQDRADLANVDSAIYEGGKLYVDHHVRLKKLAGEPPWKGLLYRNVIDCKHLTSGYASAQGINYQTGEVGENIASQSGPDMTPISRDSPMPGVCRNLQSGMPVRDALVKKHDALLASFPRFAASIRDLLRPAEFKNGEAVRYEATKLLEHLRRVNPEF